LTKVTKKISSATKSSKADTSAVVSVSKSTKQPETMEELLALEGYKFKGFKKGDAVHGKVASISGKQVLIDFGGKTEGVVGEKEWDQVKNFVSQLKPGDEIDAIVISTENNMGQMAVSIRQSGAKFRWQRADELLKSGEEVKVRGLEVNKGGLVVDFEGVKGFIPSSQLTNEHQAEIARLTNRSLTAKVIEVNQAEGRLIFSEKAVSGGADLTKKLEDVRGKVKIGGAFKGKVSAIMPYGIFVNLDNGPDGLVHISEISWQKVDNISSLYTVGQEVEVKILGINDNDAKLNLSIKQLLPDPWVKLAEKYSAEQQIKGEVTRVSTYGIFVRLEEGIEGLIHISKVPAESDYKSGDKVTCTIESVDVNAHRISLIPVLESKPIGYR
jgi:small subunit ribosomal protein S1